MPNLTPWILFYIETVVVLAAAQPEVLPRADSYGLFSNFDSSLTAIVMVIVCVFFFVGFLSVYISHCVESVDIPTAASSRPEGLDQAVIDCFPVFVYSHVKDLKTGKEELECVVCLSEFQDDETLLLLPKCSHVFHHHCISAWLAFHVTCPVCRAELTPDSDSDSDAEPVQSSSNTTVLNSDSNTESSPPTTEGSTYVVIQVIEETQQRKLHRCHSTGHSVIHPGENVESFTLRLPVRRTISYDVLFGKEEEEEEEEV
ncbi:hypothetical protein V6N13_028527 [Hibiscus sabdariffa]|uniref:RING-type E3 ubiquitin transferase n=1 Tax=Hibiscus sabdariffa TaxID=183260 RepID=A0ABR2DA63_9ROSI